MIGKMFEMQAQLNDATYPTWRTVELNWRRAIWLEAAELQDGLAWKWWKKQEVDHQNNVVELVDIWHFMMSGIMTSQKEYTIRTLIDNSIEEFEDFHTSDITEVQNLVDQLAMLTLEAYWGMAFDCFYKIWHGFYGLTISDLYVHYMTKNVLNHFRQENGYKDGYYKKIWNGKEDNVVAFGIAGTLPITETFPTELTTLLNTYYNSLS